MRTKTKKLAALVMSGVMTLSIAAPVAELYRPMIR